MKKSKNDANFLGTSAKIRFQTLITSQEFEKPGLIIVMSYIQFFMRFFMMATIFSIDELEILTILTIYISFMKKMKKNLLEAPHKQFERCQHTKIHLSGLKAQYI